MFIEKIACSNGSSRTLCRSSSRSAKLICRAAGRATDQLSEPTIAGRRPATPLPVQQRKSLAGCSVRQRIIAQIRDIAHRTGKQNLPPKTLEMPILPYYFAFRDRN
jgi:hypothetical protein